MSAKSPFETHYGEYDAWFDENANVYRLFRKACGLEG